MRPSCAATSPTPVCARSTFRRRARAKASSRSTPPTTWASIGRHGPLLVPPPPIKGVVFNQRTQVPLAKGKVRHVGEPLAVVLAQSRYLAEDALNDITVELDPLPAVVDLEKALTDAAATVHDDVRDNVAAHVWQGRGNYAAARGRADRVIARRFHYDHGASMTMETRGVVANWDARANQLTIWDTTQAPVFFRNGIAGMLGHERAAGEGHRAVRRRRLRPEDHAVLSRKRSSSRGRR